MTSGDDISRNIAAAARHIRDAARAGAGFVALPENVALMTPSRDALFASACAPESHPALQTFRTLATECSIWLLAGSIAVPSPQADRLYNRSYLLNNKGEIASYYDKIHLFDVALGEESHQESARFAPGAAAVATATPFGTVGLTICYDVRFPHLYRQLAKAGVTLFTVPSAFTYITGSAHWQVLLRARAIETGSYILAPAQAGVHPGNRHTYGHALIINPWGEVLADAGETQEGFIVAEIDPAQVTAARNKLPALTHDRDFTVR